MRKAVSSQTQTQVLIRCIKALGNNMVSVSGIALWGTRNEYGPNLGELDFTAALSGDTIRELVLRLMILLDH